MKDFKKMVDSLNLSELSSREEFVRSDLDQNADDLFILGWQVR